MKRTLLRILLAGCLIITASVCDALQPQLSFDEIVKKADVIFLGKVTDQQTRFGPNGKMIFTDVSFSVERVIYSKQEFKDKVKDIVILSLAGGRIGEIRFKVSDVPNFETEARYLVFTLMDGKPYASPIIGSFQGLFNVLTDEVSGIHYPMTFGKRPIVEIQTEDHQLRVGPPINKIRQGVMEKAGGIDQPRWKYHNVAPQAVGGTEQTHATVRPIVKEMPQKILNLEEFVLEIHKRIQTGKEGGR